jgi:hypothetical protein
MDGSNAKRNLFTSELLEIDVKYIVIIKRIKYINMNASTLLLTLTKFSCLAICPMKIILFYFILQFWSKFI